LRWRAGKLLLSARGHIGRRRRDLWLAACVWPLPPCFLSGTAAAGGIALINSIGNIGGYVGPFVVGWIKDSTNSFEMGLYFLVACSLASRAIAFFANRACSGQIAAPAE
jgi:nitrate/nitrite transporter NarK